MLSDWRKNNLHNSFSRKCDAAGNKSFGLGFMININPLDIVVFFFDYCLTNAR